MKVYKELMFDLRQEVIALRAGREKHQRLSAMATNPSSMGFEPDDSSVELARFVKEQSISQLLKQIVICLMSVNIILLCWIIVGT
ncbi:hypothetical protein LINGRAHAP2_LOCUS6771 [Linum grandiflorum]